MGDTLDAMEEGDSGDRNLVVYVSGALLVSSTDPSGDFLEESLDLSLIHETTSGELLFGY